MKPRVRFSWVKDGSYAEIWDYQTVLHSALIQRKRSTEDKSPPIHHLLFSEHKPVFTLGRSGKETHLLTDKSELLSQEIEFFKINRGGDITYHGPGQITGYLIFDLDYFFHDVHKFVYNIEESVIATLRHFGIEGFRIPKYTGVWVNSSKENGKLLKICAIGIHISRWVTLHGFAFNISTDLNKYNQIIPCGISESGLGVTSIEQETGQKVTLDEVGKILLDNLSIIFQFEILYE
ncbi:MAG: lipoyl(octanoyl) transferase LipB [Saprospiraceae bacterium]